MASTPCPCCFVRARLRCAGRPLARALNAALMAVAALAALVAAPVWAQQPAAAEAPPASAAPATPAADPAADPVAAAAEGAGVETPPAPPAPDWRGAKRDAAYFAAYQVVGLAVVYMLPDSISGWTDEKKDQNNNEWRENVGNPVMWDGDTFIVNWVLHPYWGGAYYTRARERGLSPGQSFWYSAALSAMWEFGAEAVAEPVSIQDLIFTPVLGSLLGQYVFEPWRASLRARGGELDPWEKVALVLTDPLGAINETLDGWLGLKTRMELQPFVGRLRLPGAGLGPPGAGWAAMPGAPGAYGGPAGVGLPGSARAAKVWGLRLRVEW